jgi:FkbM family methyltransferase
MDNKNYSQNGIEQDVIINYIEHFNLKSGRLLDIGAYDGETFSNVRAVMLRYNEWKGVFVEASSYCFSKVVDMYKMEPRRAELINIAIVLEEDLNNGNTLIPFHDSPMSACSSLDSSFTERGVTHHLSPSQMVNTDGDIVDPRKVYVGKVGMKEILEKFGPFDIINIDIEGFSSKLALQEWFNPNNYGCKLICIERDNWPGCAEALNDKFTGHGYTLIGRSHENMIYALT